MNCSFTSWIYTGVENKYDWMVAPLGQCDPENHDMRNWFATPWGGIYFETDDMKEALKINYSQQTNEQVLGKICKVYVSKDGTDKIYIWKRVVLLQTYKGDVEYKVYAITEDVPVSAFTKTKEHDWIQ